MVQLYDNWRLAIDPISHLQPLLFIFMDIFQLLNDLFFDYTLRTVALGTAVLGIVSGSLGSFAVLRKQSLLGDAISHAALPGVVIAFLITRSKTAGVLLIGALVAGWLATLLIINIVRYTRIKEDSALGLALSLFFGLGLMLLTITQNLPDARQAGLDRFLFGQAAALVERDIITLVVVGLLALLAVAFFWKEFKLLSFDPEYAASLGLPVRLLDVTLTTLLVVAVVIGLQAVGVILMSAMVVAPAAAARQWTNRLGKMVIIAGAIGALSGVGGTLISSTRAGLATGPVIVLVASSMVLISLLLAPNRGLAWRWVRQQRNRRQLRLETVLSDLYRLEKQHDSHEKGHSIAVLRAMNAQRGGVAHSLETLAEQKLVQQPRPNHWLLTKAGMSAAEQFLRSTQQSQTDLATDLTQADGELTP
jgi:manganese/zinc/iron transport system permease protein